MLRTLSFNACWLCLSLASCALSPEQSPPAAAVSVPVVTAAAPVTPATVPVEAQQRFDQALNQLRNGQIPAATQQLQQLANSYPTFAGPLVNLGLIELKANRHEAAASYFKQATERDAGSAGAHTYLGVSYRNLGKFKEAESAYQAAIAADDTYALAHLNLGVLYDLYLQKPELALPQFERYQALATTPDTKVAGWIKELNARLNAEKKAKATAGAAP